MKFGVREICDVVFRAKGACKVGNKLFYRDEPIMYFDTLKTSSLEAASSSVYAQGGRGNPRLVAWDGDRTLTFNMEDALISAEGLQILSGAGLLEASTSDPIIIHTTTRLAGDEVIYTPVSGNDPAKVELIVGELPYWPAASAEDPGKTISTAAVGAHLDKNASTGEVEVKYDSAKYYYINKDYAYVMLLDEYGEVFSEPFIPDVSQGIVPMKYVEGTGSGTGWQPINSDTDMSLVKGYKITLYTTDDLTGPISPETARSMTVHPGRGTNITNGRAPIYGDKIINLFSNGCGVLVDFYTYKISGAQQIEITADKFGGTYYIEGSTLFRTQQGLDMPAEFVIPNGKVQSNFTFSMAATGDPSTFTFTVDAMPDYTRFDPTKKVLAAIQIIEDGAVTDAQRERTYTTGRGVNLNAL